MADKLLPGRHATRVDVHPPEAPTKMETFWVLPGVHFSPGISIVDAAQMDRVLECPDGDPFHDHGDGCPSCDTHHCPACKVVYSGPDGCPACADEERL